MSPIEAIGTLIIRLWAASTVIFNLPLVFTYSLATEVTQNQLYFFWVFYYPGIVLLGAVFFVFARHIASVLTPKSSETSIRLTVDATDLVAIGSFLIGLYHLANKLPGTLYQTAFLVIELIQENGYLFDIKFQMDSLAIQWIVVLVALGLTFRPRDIARMFMWLRSVGPKSVTDAPEKDSQEN